MLDLFQDMSVLQRQNDELAKHMQEKKGLGLAHNRLVPQATRPTPKPFTRELWHIIEHYGTLNLSASIAVAGLGTCKEPCCHDICAGGDSGTPVKCVYIYWIYVISYLVMLCDVGDTARTLKYPRSQIVHTTKKEFGCVSIIEQGAVSP